MITIQSGKLIIPEEDRFVGFAGDNLVNMKRIVLPDHEAGSGSYTLCLRFDDDSVRVIPLEKSVSGSDLVLTWNIRKSHLLKPGIVMAQVKSVDSDDVVLHTICDYFISAGSAELSEDGAPEYVAREELEERLSEFVKRSAAAHRISVMTDTGMFSMSNRIRTCAVSPQALPSTARWQTAA